MLGLVSYSPFLWARPSESGGYDHNSQASYHVITLRYILLIGNQRYHLHVVDSVICLYSSNVTLNKLGESNGIRLGAVASLTITVPFLSGYS